MATVTYLKSLQALELAVRTGSLRATAEHLAITPAAVGQRIKSIEDYLGLELVVRGRYGVHPTPALERVLPHLNAAFDELEKAAEALDFQRVREIHIVANSDWADLWLFPRLPRFRAQNPNILFCVNGVGDVPTRIGQKDCEIWFGKSHAAHPSDSLFRDYLLPVSSSENKQRISDLPAEERLEGFPLIHLECYADDPDAIGWPDWIKAHGYRNTAPERGVRYRHVTHALDAVHSSAGLLICGLSLILGAVEKDHVALPFPISLGAWTSHAYQVRFHDRSLRRPQVQRFRDWLLDESATTANDLHRLTGNR